jgi:ADP-ribosylation factor related protein 1
LSVVGKIDIENVRLNFWDLGGQEELQSLWDKVSTVSRMKICIAKLYGLKG